MTAVLMLLSRSEWKILDLSFDDIKGERNIDKLSQLPDQYPKNTLEAFPQLYHFIMASTVALITPYASGDGVRSGCVPICKVSISMSVMFF